VKVNIQEIKNLSVAERISIIEEIWTSLDKEDLSVTEAQKSEVRERIASYKAGNSEFFTWEEIKAELHKAK